MVMNERPQHVGHRITSYSKSLAALSDSHPKTAAHLRRSQSNHETYLAEYLEGAMLRGYEELIAHLEELETAFRKSRRLQGIAFLIRRVRGNFQLGLESALSGFHSVTHDSMRDVMEVEFLLREFYYDQSRIQEWLQATPKDLNNKFRPATLRNRHAKRLSRQPDDISEATEYRGHSMMLHVSPYPHPFGGAGFSGPGGRFDTEVCLFEMFEHARRVLLQAHQLRRKVARHIKSPWGLRRGLKQFRDAWQRTQITLNIVTGLVEYRRGKEPDAPIEVKLWFELFGPRSVGQRRLRELRIV